MFFYLSKILTFLISPSVILLVLLLCAIVVKSNQRKRRLLISAFILLLVFCNPFIIRNLSKSWELKDTSFKTTQHYEIAVVLGGFMSRDEDSDRLTFGDAVDRMNETLVLYRHGKVDKFLISGGSGMITKDVREASLAKNFLVQYCNVPDSVILFDTLSRNTYENAIESKKILQQQKIKKALLVTSAFHMRRAKGCFDSVDIITDTYSTDVMRKQTYYLHDLIVPATENILQWEILMREVAGVIIYKLQGYT